MHNDEQCQGGKVQRKGPEASGRGGEGLCMYTRCVHSKAYRSRALKLKSESSYVNRQRCLCRPVPVRPEAVFDAAVLIITRYSMHSLTVHHGADGRLLYHSSTAFLFPIARSAFIGGGLTEAAASFSSAQSSFPEQCQCSTLRHIAAPTSHMLVSVHII